MRFLSTVPWCLLHLSNHSPFIKHISDVLLLEPLALLDQTRGESKYNS
jgi:hypothetical protein